MKNSLFVLLITLLTVSCGQKTETPQTQSPSSEYVDISVLEFNTEFSQPDTNTIILDVRTDREFQAGAIPNAVQLNFMSPDFKAEVAKLDPEKTYVVYCQSGGRSSAASKIMTQELGFKDVKNLEGGYASWSNSQ